VTLWHDHLPVGHAHRDLSLAGPGGGAAWWKELRGIDPYFEKPFYVGFNVAGTSRDCFRMPIRPPAP